jgi:Cu-Zn family superoxide dismutase
MVTPARKGVRLIAIFNKLPPGKHGFHIHRAGDLRMKDCSGLCEHFDKGRHSHGAGPHSKTGRHTGDLGNIQLHSTRKTMKKRYDLPNVSVQELWGRSIIVHADEDDLGKGSHSDSHTTGHSGKRIGCAIFGRL